MTLMGKIKEAAICKNSISNSMTSRSTLLWKKKEKKDGTINLTIKTN